MSQPTDSNPSTNIVVEILCRFTKRYENEMNLLQILLNHIHKQGILECGL